MRRGFLTLHCLLLLYSFSGVFSKLAANTQFPGFRFFAYYGAGLLILFLYAIGWQQVIKWMPLSSAFANKAVTTIWGTVWGVLLFSEKVTLGKAVGILMIIGGIVILSLDEGVSRLE
ncbi:MAG: transporter [Clostridia bacterium]|nr:transporter [Clostridia bacterium]